MPMIRNPFRRTEDSARTTDVDRRNASAPRSIDIKEPAEYKLSGSSARVANWGKDMGANIIQKSMTVVFTFLYALRAPNHESLDTDA